MWLFSVYGFFSVVCLNSRPLDGSPAKGKITVDTTRVAVRARVRAHLESLLKDYPDLASLSDILDTPGRDYACRVLVSKEKWARTVMEIAQDIDYENFKGRVGHADVTYASWLSKVWSIGHRVQESIPQVDKAKMAARKEAIDALAKMPTRDFIRLIRREFRVHSLSELDAMYWRALRERGWAEVTGEGIHMAFNLTDEGKRRLGLS